MSELRYFKVTQEREVRVSALNALDAARIADLAFVNGQDDYGNAIGPVSDDLTARTLTPIRVRDLVVREDY